MSKWQVFNYEGEGVGGVEGAVKVAVKQNINVEVETRAIHSIRMFGNAAYSMIIYATASVLINWL